MQNLIGAVQKSCDTENWYAALYMALTMPDICASLEQPGTTNKGARYKAWFDAYLRAEFEAELATGPTIFLGAEDCWALRNSVLHEGADMLQGAKAALSQVKFTSLGPHCNKVDDVVMLNVRRFCEAVIRGVQGWLAAKGAEPAIAERIAAMATVETSRFQIGPVTFG